MPADGARGTEARRGIVLEASREIREMSQGGLASPSPKVREVHTRRPPRVQALAIERESVPASGALEVIAHPVTAPAVKHLRGAVRIRDGAAPFRHLHEIVV